MLCADDQLGLRRRELREDGNVIDEGSSGVGGGGNGLGEGGNRLGGGVKELRESGKRKSRKGLNRVGRGLGGGGEVGGEPIEIARYVTPFSRRSGRWLTPATQFVPLLLSLPSTSKTTTTSSSSSSSSFSSTSSLKTCESFLFQSYSEGSQWIVSSNLRFTNWGTPPPKKYSPLYAFSEFFRPATYNINRTLHINIPQVCFLTHSLNDFPSPSLHIFNIHSIPPQHPLPFSTGLFPL